LLAADDCRIGNVDGTASEEALRGVTQQQQVLDGIRARASTLLGIAAISASFLGGVALNKDGPTGLTWIPIGAFVAVGLLTTWILLRYAAGNSAWTQRS
jgi:hypothetical protein